MINKEMLTQFIYKPTYLTGKLLTMKKFEIYYCSYVYSRKKVGKSYDTFEQLLRIIYK